MSRESIAGRRITHTLRCSERMVLAKTVAQQQLDASRSILEDLDELGDIMSDMLQKQQDVEVRFPLCCLPVTHLSIHDSNPSPCCCTGRLRRSLGSTSTAIAGCRGPAPQIRPVPIVV